MGYTILGYPTACQWYKVYSVSEDKSKSFKQKAKGPKKDKNVPYDQKRAWNYALWLLGRQLYTRKGIEDKLKKKETSAEDIEIIDEYIIDNNIDAEQHSSGIFFQHHELGTGATPTGSDSVNLTYEIRLLIEGWVDEGENVDFWMGHLIQAWQISLQWIQEGGRMTIYAPTLYCYGPLGTGPIPPNSILVFDIELHSTTAGD